MPDGPRAGADLRPKSSGSRSRHSKPVFQFNDPLAGAAPSRVLTPSNLGLAI
jgi:hypothetical protein